MKKEEEQIIERIEKENKQYRAEKEVQVPEYNDVDYMPPTDMEGYIPEENIVPELEQETEVKEYIMGKPSKAKEKLIKIKDITADNGRITLEGRVVSVDVRETRSGKGMIMIPSCF